MSGWLKGSLPNRFMISCSNLHQHNSSALLILFAATTTYAK